MVNEIQGVTVRKNIGILYLTYSFKRYFIQFERRLLFGKLSYNPNEKHCKKYTKGKIL